MHTGFASFLFAPILALSALFGLQASTTALVPAVATSSIPVMCTMEAKICPDGSYVGRVGPDCHFAACPGATSTPADDNTDSTSSLPAIRAPQGPGAAAAAKDVTIYSITPHEGPVGTEITIDGSGFTGDNTIHFGQGVIMHAAAGDGIAIMCATDARDCHPGIHRHLTFTVPDALLPACAFATPVHCMIASIGTQPGQYDISVENAHGTSNAVSFTVTSGADAGQGDAAAPAIVSMTPAEGSVGTEVTIGGDHLDGARVHFGAGVITDATVKPAIFHCPMMRPGQTGGCGAFSETLTFTVPASVGPYCKQGEMCPMFRQAIVPGSYPISIETDAGTSGSETFTVTGA